jgi:hypothetical protein
MKTIQAFFINAKEQTVTQMEIKQDLQTYYDLIGCRVVDGIYLDADNFCYVDDEGLLKEQEGYFTLANFPRPFAGNGIIVGTDEEGNDVSSKLVLEEVVKNVKFYRPDELSHDLKEPFMQFMPHH